MQQQYAGCVGGPGEMVELDLVAVRSGDLLALRVDLHASPAELSPERLQVAAR